MVYSKKGIFVYLSNQSEILSEFQLYFDSLITSLQGNCEDHDMKNSYIISYMKIFKNLIQAKMKNSFE